MACIAPFCTLEFITELLNAKQETILNQIVFSATVHGTPHIQSNILSQLTAAHSPATTAHNLISQYGPNSGFTTSVGTVDRLVPNLIERTRNLRDWLRQARIESSDLISPGQATL